MAKEKPKAKTKKRQPAKSRLSSSLAEKPKKTAKKAKTLVKKVKPKTTVKKNTVKKTQKNTKAKKITPAKKRQVPKKPVRKTRRTRNVSIPLGCKTRLTLSIKLSKSPSKKRKAKSKSKLQRVQKTLAIKKQFLVSLAMVFLGVSGTVYFGLQVAAAPLPQGNDTPISQDSTIPAPTEKYLPHSAAKRLQVPAIGLDTKLISLGRNTDGTLETPKRYDIAGYYKFGPTPGEKGPAVIAGHLDNYYSGPAVFWRLKELKPGEIIKVNRADGKTAKFKVNSVKEYSQSDFPTQQVYGNIDHAGLRLITCGGSFNFISQRYSDNTIVFASLIR